MICWGIYLGGFVLESKTFILDYSQLNCVGFSILKIKLYLHILLNMLLTNRYNINGALSEIRTQ